jgi:hypothetical protein
MSDEETAIRYEYPYRGKHKEDQEKKIERLQAVVDAARVEAARHERIEGGLCDCPLCEAICALEGEQIPPAGITPDHADHGHDGEVKP